MPGIDAKLKRPLSRVWAVISLVLLAGLFVGGLLDQTGRSGRAFTSFWPAWVILGVVVHCAVRVRQERRTKTLEQLKLTGIGEAAIGASFLHTPRRWGLGLLVLGAPLYLVPHCRDSFGFSDDLSALSCFVTLPARALLALDGLLQLPGSGASAQGLVSLGTRVAWGAACVFVDALTLELVALLTCQRALAARSLAASAVWPLVHVVIAVLAVTVSQFMLALNVVAVVCLTMSNALLFSTSAALQGGILVAFRAVFCRGGFLHHDDTLSLSSASSSRKRRLAIESACLAGTFLALIGLTTWRMKQWLMIRDEFRRCAPLSQVPAPRSLEEHQNAWRFWIRLPASLRRTSPWEPVRHWWNGGLMAHVKAAGMEELVDKAVIRAVGTELGSRIDYWDIQDLGDLGKHKQDGVQILVQLLNKRKDKPIQEACVGALSIIGNGDSEAIAALAKALRVSTHESVRASAAIAIGSVARGEISAATPLLVALEKDVSPYVREAAAKGLADLKAHDEPVLQGLMRAFKHDEEVDVRQAAREALEKIKKAQQEKQAKAKQPVETPAKPD